jgi:hypothetical protein
MGVQCVGDERGKQGDAGGERRDHDDVVEASLDADFSLIRLAPPDTGTPSMMTTIIQRAVERGEIDPVRLSPRIVSLPVDLVRHDLIMTRAPVPDETLVEIVDRIFLPLVLADHSDPTRSRSWG